jgi:hypothetical protein
MPEYTASFAVDVLGGDHIYVEAATPEEALKKLQSMYDKVYEDDNDNPFNHWETIASEGGTNPRITRLYWIDKNGEPRYFGCDHLLEGNYVRSLELEATHLIDRVKFLLQRKRKLVRNKEGRPIQNKDGTFRYQPLKFSVHELLELQTNTNYLCHRLGKPILEVEHEDPDAPYQKENTR